MKDINVMSDVEIDNYMQERRRLRWEQQRKLEQQKKQLFKEEVGVDIYEASDYCGASIGQHSFYYGYEVTANEHEDGAEWCFVAKFGGAPELKIPTSKLWYIEDASMMWYLVSGMAQYIQKLEAKS